MAWGGTPPNQTYTRTDGTRSGAAVNVTAKANGVNDTAVLADNRENDFATALNLVLKRDGGNSPIGNIDWNTFKLTNMGAGSARTDSLRIDQVQDGDFLYAAVDGTANAIELALTPVSGGPVEGMTVVFIPTDDSSSTVTIDLDEAGTVALQYNAAALAGGELQAGLPARITFDGAVWQLENPFYNFPALYQPLDAGLTDIAALAVTDGNFIVGNGTNWVAESGATARASLGLTIGTNVQAFDAQLSDVAGLTPSDNAFIVGNGSNFVTESGATAQTSLGISAFAQTVLDDANAAAALVTLGAASRINLQTFTASGTYTPTSGMKYCLVFSTGGGGGGGGVDSSSNSSGIVAVGGGGAGGTCIELFSAATIGANQTVTVGAGGTAGAATGGNGGNGGDTTFGALHTATGGEGALGFFGSGSIHAVQGGLGGAPSGGTLNIPGGDGTGGITDATSIFGFAGNGGGSFWGGGTRGLASNISSASIAGLDGRAYGAGASGATLSETTLGAAGGVGAGGVVVVLELI